MFFRQKQSGNRIDLQVVENRWEEGRSKQRVIAKLCRLNHPQQSGQLEGLLESGARFCESILILAAHRRGETTAMRTRWIGPALIFGRLWNETGCGVLDQRSLIGRSGPEKTAQPWVRVWIDEAVEGRGNVGAEDRVGPGSPAASGAYS